MKGKTLWGMGLFALSVGVLLLLFRMEVTSYRIVVVAGVLFLLAGLVNLIITTHRKNMTALTRTLSQLANAAALILGVCLIAFVSVFEPLVSVIFGVFIAACALWQFFVLAIAARPHQLPGWMYLFPLLIAAAAIYIFVSKDLAEPMVMLVCSISLAVLGCACMIEGSVLGKMRRNALNAPENTTDDLDSPAKIEEKSEKEAQ